MAAKSSKSQKSMVITHGLLEGQVLQRDAVDRGHARITGTCKHSGDVEIRVLKEGPSAIQSWHKAGSAAGNSFSAQLKGVPCGGPYAVELRVVDKRKTVESLLINDIFVGDVWFLGGQSNMQGIGNMVNAPSPNPRIRAFYMCDEWRLAEDPLHVLQEAVDCVHNGGNAITRSEADYYRKTTLKGVGPGLWFAKEMIKRSKVPQGLVICAHGGTSMDQWNPALKDKEGASLYGAMLRRYKKLGQPIKGVLWYQGESDCNQNAAPVYTEKMIKLCQETRDDFGLPELPWLIVQIGCVISDTWDAQAWQSVQEQQRVLPNVIPNLAVVPSVDLTLDDSIHISADGHAILGSRLACVADRLAQGNKKEKDAIDVESIQLVVTNKINGISLNCIEIRFRNVYGKLECQGIPTGFSFIDDGNSVAFHHRTHIKGNCVYLEITTAQLVSVNRLKLAHGFGNYPYCNITDKRGMGLPVFGPLPIQNLDGTDFVLDWQVSKVEIVPGGVKNATLAIAQKALKETVKPFANTDFMVSPQDYQKGKQGIFFMKTSVRSKKSIELKVAMGSDSPFRLWVNGKCILEDEQAVNPCLPDQYIAPAKLKKGDNQLIIAFDGRGGEGWGVCVRFIQKSKTIKIPDNCLSFK